VQVSATQSYGGLETTSIQMPEPAGATYYFMIRAYDSSNNESDLDTLSLSSATQVHAYSYTEPADNTPPSPITDLTAQTGTSPGEITITWTAVGDDGNSGTASGYLVKYSKNPITSANFNSADTYSQDWIPASAGMTETKTITLTPGDTYYVAVKAYDDNPYGANYSDWDESYYTDNKNRATAKNFENLLKIPNASFENGSLGWSFNSSYIYVSQSYAYDGVYSCKVNDPTSSTDGREISSVYADVTAGLVYGAGAYFLVE